MVFVQFSHLSGAKRLVIVLHYERVFPLSKIGGMQRFRAGAGKAFGAKGAALGLILASSPLMSCGATDLTLHSESRGEQVNVAISEDDLRPYFPFVNVRFVMLKDRRPGPMSWEEVETYLKRFENMRRYVNIAFPINRSALERVLTADAAGLFECLLSNDAALVEEAAFEAAIRADAQLTSALVRTLDKIDVVSGDELTRLPVMFYPRQTIIVSAIGRMGTAEAHGILRRLLDHEDVYVRLTSAYLLATRGEKECMETLREALSLTKAGKMYLSDGIKFGKALLSLGFGKTKKELDELFDSLDSEARYLAPILRERGDELSLSYLREQVVNQSRYHGVRKWAATALGEARDKKAIPFLRQATSDSVRDVREEAKKALELIGEG